MLAVGSRGHQSGFDPLSNQIALEAGALHQDRALQLASQVDVDRSNA